MKQLYIPAHQIKLRLLASLKKTMGIIEMPIV